MNLVSVVLAVYKDDGFFDLAIDSIINQTYSNLEIIIVANNCNDELWEKILFYSRKDSRVRPYRLDIGGLAFALNYGIEKSKGSYIARMDADDISLDKRIEKQIKFLLENRDISVVGTQIQYINIHGDNVIRGRTHVPLNHMNIQKFMKTRCPFWHPTVMFRKNDIIKLGGYKYGFYGEDYDLWIRGYLAGLKFANLDEVLLKYRTHENQMSSTHGKIAISSLLLFYFNQTRDFNFLKGSFLYSKCIQFLIVKTTKIRMKLKGKKDV